MLSCYGSFFVMWISGINLKLVWVAHISGQYLKLVLHWFESVLHVFVHSEINRRLSKWFTSQLGYSGLSLPHASPVFGLAWNLCCSPCLFLESLQSSPAHRARKITFLSVLPSCVLATLSSEACHQSKAKRKNEIWHISSYWLLFQVLTALQNLPAFV